MATTGEIVFISYSREDEEYARRLSEDLKKAGAIPWLDLDQILPGHNWEVKIRNAIDQSRYFIPLLSSRSKDKTGYIQAELKYALEHYDKIPESQIGIIPVRIDDCEMPYEKLKKIHHADLFPDWANGVSKILKSMGITYTKKVIEVNKEEGVIGLSEADWNTLLNSIRIKKCIPFIGNGIWQLRDGTTLLPSIKSIVELWKNDLSDLLKDSYHSARVSTLDDSYQLARLAQFLEMDTNKKDPRKILSTILDEIDPSVLDSRFGNNSPYDVLANLDLPIYMTTNYDKFLETILTKKRNRKSVTELCTWYDILMRAVAEGEIPSVFRKEEFNLSVESPVVYHILGHIDQPQSMVLTEKDYFEYVVNLTKNKETYTIPAKIRTQFIKATLLFIGYSLEDINFRAIFQGFLSFKVLRDNLRIAVQIPPVISREKQKEIQKFLNRYTENVFQVSIYWGTISDFMTDLNNRWEAFKTALISRPTSLRPE
jgi:hypothetical protein